MSITLDAEQLWQWDTGVQVLAEGCDEVHFAKRPGGPCYDAAVIGGKASVPDVLLQTAGAVYAWAYATSDAGGKTRVQASWPVARRGMPAGYTFTPWAQRTIADAEQARDQAKDYAEAAKEAADAAKASEVKGARAVTLEPGSEATARMDGNVLEVGVPKGERGDCDFAAFEVVGGYLVANYTTDKADITFGLTDEGDIEVMLLG